MSSNIFFIVFFLLFPSIIHASGSWSYMHPNCAPPKPPVINVPVFPLDVDLMQFALNLEHTECEWFLFGSAGYGLDAIEPELAWGGPPPLGARKANLDVLTRRLIYEFGLQEVGHIRAIRTSVGGFPRPLIDLSQRNFAKLFDEAFGYSLEPPFDPYYSTTNYLLASYVIPYMGLVGYVGANPNINGYVTKRILAGLLAVEAAQDGIIRSWLFQRLAERVHPYNKTVADFTNRISGLRNRLAMCGIKDEGLVVPIELGAEQRIYTNVISADKNSLAYARTPREILRTAYTTGNEQQPGGFFPEGANGDIARELLGNY